MAKQMDRQKQSARKDTAKKTADKACTRRAAPRIAARPRTATEVAKTSRIGASFFAPFALAGRNVLTRLTKRLYNITIK